VTADGRSRLPVICVLGESALQVDHDGFAGLCRAASAEVGVPLTVSFHAREHDLVAAVQQASEQGGGIVLIAGGLGDSRVVQQAALQAAAPLVWLDLAAARDRRPEHLDPIAISSIRGRGLEGLSWAVRSLVARAAWPAITERYGPDVEHVGDLRVPSASAGPHPVCVLLHGGGWRERWERDLMDGIAADLCLRGYATWNLEYRRVGPSDGGWPNTLADAAAGIDHLTQFAGRHPLDLDRVALLGHSAGGHLATWAATRGKLPVDAPGSQPAVHPALVVSIAGNPDLVLSAVRATDEGSTIELMGGMPDEIPEAYALASPKERLPLGCAQLLIWGTRDQPDLVDRNRRYCVAAVSAGDDIDVLALAGADHFSVIDPTNIAWTAIVERLIRVFPVAG
jgi:acetyl esterase/lipase